MTGSMARVQSTMSRQSLLDEGAFTFENVLDDRINFHYLKKFCLESDLSTENLLAWLELTEFKQVWCESQTHSLHAC